MTKWGISTNIPRTPSNYYEEAYKIGLRVHHLNMVSGYTGTAWRNELEWIKELATFCEADPENEIWVELEPAWGWNYEDWWINCVEKAMQELQAYPAVKRFGLYAWEWFGTKVGETKKDYTRDEHIAAYQRFNNLATSYGYGITHWIDHYMIYSGGFTSLGDARDSLCGGVAGCLRCGAFPDGAGGGQLSKPIEEWQYSIVAKTTRDTNSQSLGHAIGTGMWSYDCSGPYAGMGREGKYWSDRHTRWFIQAVREEAPTVEYAFFLCIGCYMLCGVPLGHGQPDGWTGNQEFKDVCSELIAGIVPPKGNVEINVQGVEADTPVTVTLRR